jgi:fibronectin type 3 domain-containing protein
MIVTFLMLCLSLLSAQSQTANVGTLRVQSNLAGDINLAWDSSTSEGVTNYTLYRGSGAANYQEHVALGNVTSTVVSRLIQGRITHFAVTASNEFGESDFSNDLAYIAP